MINLCFEITDPHGLYVTPCSELTSAILAFGNYEIQMYNVGRPERIFQHNNFIAISIMALITANIPSDSLISVQIGSITPDREDRIKATLGQLSF